jgi:hypothetical protein
MNMADDTNGNRLIAAHLTAALISRLPNDGLRAAQAVNLFNEVLDELNKGRAGNINHEPPSRFYESSNGDFWSLVYDAHSRRPSVMHQPNEGSGGQASYIDVDQFLRQSPSGPQHQALLRLMEAGHSAGDASAS